jgi:hypothetical protein
MTYKVTPTNRAANEAVQTIAALVDGRLSIPEDEKLEVAAYLLAHRHQESIHLAGYPKMMAALLSADAIGRAGGKADVFVKPAFADLQELTFAAYFARFGHRFRAILGTRFTPSWAAISRMRAG